MAPTVKDVIEILQKYEKPDEPIIWQYYTRHEFDYNYEQPEISKEDFAQIIDRVERVDVWEAIPAAISDAIWEYQNEEGQH